MHIVIQSHRHCRALLIDFFQNIAAKSQRLRALRVDVATDNSRDKIS